MYGRLGTPEIRVQASFGIMCIQGRTFKIKCLYFIRKALFKGLSEKLQRLQNRAARILMSASYDSNLDDLFRALGGEDSTIKDWNKNLS